MDFTRLLQIEEEQVQKMCEDIITLKPDLVFTEKGVSGKLQVSCTIDPPSLHALTIIPHYRPCPALSNEEQHYCNPSS